VDLNNYFECSIGSELCSIDSEGRSIGSELRSIGIDKRANGIDRQFYFTPDFVVNFFVPLTYKI